MLRKIGLALVLMGVTLFSLYRVTGGWFYTDDFLNLEDLLEKLNHPSLTLLGPTANQFDLFRPLIRFSWILNYWLNGFDASGYYWFNLIVHSANVGLVFLFCLLLGMSLSSAGLAGFFFAIGPRKLGAVLWIAGRTESLAFFFVLLALVLWAQGRKRESVRLRRWSLVPLVISFLVKEWAPFYGFLLLAWSDYYLTRRFNWRDLAAPFLLCGAYLAGITIFHRGGSHIGIGWHVPKMLLNGLGQTMMPGLSYPRWLLAGEIIAIIVYPFALASGKLGRFAFVWILLVLIAPSLLLFHDHIVDWNLYPAGVGVAISLACALEAALRLSERFPRRVALLRVSAAGLLFLFGVSQLILVHRWIEREGVPRGWEWRSYLASNRGLPETMGDARQRRASLKVFSSLPPGSPVPTRSRQPPALR